MKKCILIVVDSLGCGDAPDASKYNKLGANTVKNVSKKVSGLNLPNFDLLGLGKVTEIEGLNSKNIKGSYGKLTPQSINNDSTTGHWELAGVVSDDPFALYTDGFPEEIINEIVKETNYEFIGNKHASGTEIIKELGKEHLESKKLILYTSGDSVFQIAAHEDVISVKELYQICSIARNKLDKYRIGRVIARPFVGNEGKFPPGGTILQLLTANNYTTFGIGKIKDLFGNNYLSKYIHTEGDEDGMQILIKSIEQENFDFTFVNLVDCDMLYGHREDPKGYAKGLELIDKYLGILLKQIDKDDLLLITGDHGNDPTDGDTDHTREYVPILSYSKNSGSVDLNTRASFTDVGKTIAEFFSLKNNIDGYSFLNKVVK